MKEKIIKKKFIGLLVGMLLITTVLPVASTDKIELRNTSTITNRKLMEEYADFVPGEFIVKFKAETIVDVTESLDGWICTGLPSIDILNEKHRVSSINKLFNSCKKTYDEKPDLYNIFKFNVPQDSDILSIVQEYLLDSHVMYAEPNYIYHTCAIPNDPDFNLQWALHNTGQTGGTVDADIDAPEAWDIETGDADVIIAVVDSGIDLIHPDLIDNIWTNEDEIPFNGIDDDENGVIDDIHGTSFIEEEDDINPYGEPSSYDMYGLWKDETEIWHFRFGAASDTKFFGDIITDGSFHDVTPVNLSVDEYTITNHSVSFNVIDPYQEGGFDFESIGMVLHFDVYIGHRWHGTWLVGNGFLLIGEDMFDDIMCPFAYRFGNSTFDDFGHGTHCAGIISAVGNNNEGIAGVCWNCTIMPVKAFPQWTFCGGSYARMEDLVSSIYYAVDNGADIISMGWGSYSNSQTLKDAIDYANDLGVILIAAVGNDNINTEFYPAAYDTVIAVAATDHNDTKVFFSNYGYWVNVAAPGEDIYSTMLTYETYFLYYFNSIKQNYCNMSGTSMACSHVAGLAGLILSKNPSYSPEDVKSIICENVDPYNSDEYIGTGRINAFKAITAGSELEVGEITGGIGKVYAEIKNVGDVNATDVNWSISVYGYIRPIWGEWEGTIPNLLAGETEIVSTDGLILGLGRVRIEVTASAQGADMVEKEVNGFIVFFFVII